MSEKIEAKRIDAKLVKNSGRGAKKGDAIWHQFVIDFKERKSFSINSEAWKKACMDAYSYGIEKEPLFIVVLPSGARVAILDFDELERLVEG